MVSETIHCCLSVCVCVLGLGDGPIYCKVGIFFFIYFPQKETEAHWGQSDTISKNSAKSFDFKSRKLSSQKILKFLKLFLVYKAFLKENDE